jgi:hypothetical protein
MDKQRFENALLRLEFALRDADVIKEMVGEYLQECAQPIKAKEEELRALAVACDEKKTLLNSLISEIDRCEKKIANTQEWTGTKEEFIIRQLHAAIDAQNWYQLKQREVRSTLGRAINKRINDLVAISKLRLPNGQVKEWSKIVSESRKKLAVELQSGRRRLRDLLNELSRNSSYLETINQIVIQNNFSPVPAPQLCATQTKNGKSMIPEAAGIYFLWEGQAIAYVGQSKNLAFRVILGMHHRLKEEDRISYISPIETTELKYHEAFYIGVCRPWRNGRV